MQKIGQKWPFLHIIKQNRSLCKSPNNRGRAIFGHEKARTLTPPKLLTNMRKTCVICPKSAISHQDLTKICARGGLLIRYFRQKSGYFGAISAYFRTKSGYFQPNLARKCTRKGLKSTRNVGEIARIGPKMG